MSAPSRMRLGILGALCLPLWLAAPGARAADPDLWDLFEDFEQAGKGFSAKWSFGHFGGDYGRDVTTELQSFTTGLRWMLPRGQVRLNLPLLRVTNVGNVTFVGDRPVNFRTDRQTDRKLTRDRLPAPSSESNSGIGDVTVQGELDFLRSGISRPWLTGILRVKLPTADEQQGLGTGEVDVEGALALTKPFGRSDLLLDAGYTKVGEPEGLAYEEIIRLAAGISTRLGRSGTLLDVYLENRTHPVPGEADRLDLSLGTGRRFGQRSQLQFGAAVFAGLSGTAEDFGISLSLARSF